MLLPLSLALLGVTCTGLSTAAAAGAERAYTNAWAGVRGLSLSLSLSLALWLSDSLAL